MLHFLHFLQDFHAGRSCRTALSRRTRNSLNIPAVIGSMEKYIHGPEHKWLCRLTKGYGQERMYPVHDEAKFGDKPG